MQLADILQRCLELGFIVFFSVLFTACGDPPPEPYPEPYRLDLRTKLQNFADSEDQVIDLRRTAPQDLVQLRHSAFSKVAEINSTDVIDDNALKSVAFLSNLKRLSLKYDPKKGTRITDKGICHLARLKKLEKLQLLGVGLTDGGMHCLGEIKSLEELRLDNTRITDKRLSQLAKLPNLKRLSLGNNTAEDSNVYWTVGIRRMWPVMTSVCHPNVFQCNFRYKTRVTDKGLQEIGKLTQLEQLNLRRTNITSRGLVHLAKLTALEVLILDYNFIGRGLRHIQNLTQLKVLGILETGATIAEAPRGRKKCVYDSLKPHYKPRPGRPVSKVKALNCRG